MTYWSAHLSLDLVHCLTFNVMKWHWKLDNRPSLKEEGNFSIYTTLHSIILQSYSCSIPACPVHGVELNFLCFWMMPVFNSLINALCFNLVTVESKTLFLCNRYRVCRSDSKVWWTKEIHVVMINSLLSSAEMVRTAQPSTKVSLSKLLGYELHWDSTIVQSSVSNICLLNHIL
jgi:hypothetical protein